ncbi:MAG: type II toxin-antitoxin system RelE/ParE family toxin [Anaerolineae bacterium]|nr:type II toxin-antitoxin system RelE/ParE family toxin [Anaerolineae bacterium]
MPGAYRLIVTERFYKDMRKIERKDQQRILAALREIEADPYRGRKVVAAETGQYRWRVGDYRIRYDIEDDKVYVLRVRKRAEA